LPKTIEALLLARIGLTKLMDLERIRRTMRSRDIICVLFISIVLLASSGCMAENNAGTLATGLAVPKANLPEGFKLIAALPENDPSVNMTDYIKGFYGAENIGPANASVGIYQWGTPGIAYDAKITLIQLSDEEHAKAAVSNYKSQPEYQELLAKGLPIFGNATVNGHHVLEIKEIRGDGSIKYLYLWNAGSVVALIEGNGDRGQSLELASTTGL
jgi:hypothetical protein